MADTGDWRPISYLSLLLLCYCYRSGIDDDNARTDEPTKRIGMRCGDVECYAALRCSSDGARGQCICAMSARGGAQFKPQIRAAGKGLILEQSAAR